MPFDNKLTIKLNLKAIKLNLKAPVQSIIEIVNILFTTVYLEIRLTSVAPDPYRKIIESIRWHLYF